MKDGTTDRIREYARTNIIDPARREHLSTVQIVAGEVHKMLGLRSRVPAVCAALGSRRFLQENNLQLIDTSGPPSGQGPRVTFTYRLDDPLGETQAQQNRAAFLKLRGIAKEVFQSLGGGEAFLRTEREQFYPPERKE